MTLPPERSALEDRITVLWGFVSGFQWPIPISAHTHSPCKPFRLSDSINLPRCSLLFFFLHSHFNLKYLLRWLHPFKQAWKSLEIRDWVLPLFSPPLPPPSTFHAHYSLWITRVPEGKAGKPRALNSGLLQGTFKRKSSQTDERARPNLE